MANTFRKYEFTPSTWATLRKKIEQTTEEGTTFVNCAVHEIGYICLQWGKDAEGMPVCEGLYLQGYCAKFPDSPFCVIPEPVNDGEG